MTDRVSVGGSAPYDVVIGRGLAGELPPLLDGCSQVALVHPRAMSAEAAWLADSLRGLLPAVHLLAVPDGEAAKDLSVAAELWESLGRLRLGRTDAVVGLGGGATTDLAGFVAATWLRGVRVVLVPTTLLGMVDAAVGGKTGINTAAGKNLVGSFHPPVGVLCDLDRLATLPDAEWASGLAEVAKCGFIADPGILDLLERPREHVAELVRRAVQVKADVVGADLREGGPREVLNYGHTLGHAIEHAEAYRWRHGAAIAVGMVFAAALGRESGREDLVALHRDVLARLDLPVRYPAAAWPALREAMRGDKKTRAGRLRFVVLDRLGAPAVLDGPPAQLLDAAYQEVAT